MGTNPRNVTKKNKEEEQPHQKHWLWIIILNITVYIYLHTIWFLCILSLCLQPNKSKKANQKTKTQHRTVGQNIEESSLLLLFFFSLEIV